MSYHEQSDKLAGPIALLKQYAISALFSRPKADGPQSRFVSKAGRETAEDATQIFGGRGITASGMGKIIENVSRHVSSLSMMLTPCQVSPDVAFRCYPCWR